MSVPFPEKGTPEKEIRDKLEKIEKLLKPLSSYSLRLEKTNPHPLSIDVINKFVHYNKNNIGTHTRGKESNAMLYKLEKEVILMLGNLMGSSTKEVDGYITQGGTEGNLMGMWIGRNRLRNERKIGVESDAETCLIKTDLTHYSVDKAADILSIHKVENVKLAEDYGMDPQELRATITRLASEGYKNFLILLTLGYSTTGTVDPIDKIDAIAKEAKKKLEVNVYVHIDAAFGGLIYPFVSEISFDFSFSSVNSISLDFHKTGFLPQAAGVFICRKGLQKFIERSADYLWRGIDDTLSGSRPAIWAIAAWAIINLLGKHGFSKVVNECLELKGYLMGTLKKNYSNLPHTYISHPCIPLIAINFDFLLDGKLPSNLEKKYKLVGFTLPLNSVKKKIYYRLVFMPHLTKKVLKEFMEDILVIKNRA
jgi:tyrosine decarboxylase / aspartate 1-decarboxylase